MTYNPTLGDSREDYDMAVALGYDWVDRAHSGEDIPLSERVLERDPFTITDDGRHVIVREVSVRPDGSPRWSPTSLRPYRRVKLLHNPLR